MHPTVDEQLRGIDRLLRAVAADDGLSPDAAEALADASRMVRRLELSWPQTLNFLERDNRATEAVLADVAPLLPPEFAAASSRLGADSTTAHERNQALRGLLADAIVALPDGDNGARARTAIAAHLRERIDRNPALGRVVGE
jgi:hypothetical protein